MGEKTTQFMSSFVVATIGVLLVAPLPLELKVGGSVLTFGVGYLVTRRHDAKADPNPSAEELESYGSALRQRIREQTAPRLLVPPAFEEGLRVRLASRPDAVVNPLLEQVRPMPPDPTFADAFEAADRRLLVLGNKGAGKTVALYRLIESLTAGDSGDVVLVNATGWIFAETFEAGLVAYLDRTFGLGSRKLAAAWLKSAVPVIVVDGLDELGHREDPNRFELRRRLLRQLASWQVGVDKRGVVISSRVDEWRRLEEKAPSVHGIELLPLDDTAVDGVIRVLAARDPEWSEASPGTGPYEALRTPLLASLAIEAEVTFESLSGSTDIELQVCEEFIDARLEGLDLNEKAYLAWIADFLNGREVTMWGHRSQDPLVFSAQSLTPSSVPNELRVLFGFVMSIVVGLSFAILTEGAAGPRVAALVGLLTGLAGGSAGILSAYFSGAPPARTQTRLRRDRLWSDLRRGLILGLAVGLTVGTTAGLLFSWSYGLFAGVVLAAFGVLLFGVDSNVRRTDFYLSGVGFDSELRESRTSFLNGLLIGGASGLGMTLTLLIYFGLSFGWSQPIAILGLCGLLLSIAMCLLIGFESGGWFVTLQGIVRDRLRRRGVLPGDLGEFCAAMADDGLLRPSGLGYCFRHDMIQSALHTSSRARLREAGNPAT